MSKKTDLKGTTQLIAYSWAVKPEHILYFNHLSKWARIFFKTLDFFHLYKHFLMGEIH